MSKSATAETEPDDVAAPAIITPMHVQDRHTHTRAGSKMAWTRLSFFEQAHRLGHLIDRDKCGPTEEDEKTKAEIGRALNRYNAGNEFTGLFLIGDPNSSFPGASDLSRVRVAGSKLPWSQHQHEARSELRLIKQCLGVRDYKIVEAVCGMDVKISKAVAAITPGYKFATLVRFREALDALIDAMETARRLPRNQKNVTPFG